MPKAQLLRFMDYGLLFLKTCLKFSLVYWSYFAVINIKTFY